MRKLTLFLALLVALAPMALAQDESEEKDDDQPELEEQHGDDRARDNESDSHDEKDERADDEREGRDESDDRDEEARKVKIEVSQSQAQIKLSRENGSLEDEVKIVYEPSEGAMKIGYELENETSELESELKVRFRELLEYEDVDGDEKYTPRVDTIVQEFNIEDLDWTLVGPDDVTATDGTPGKRLMGRGAIPDSNGTLTFVMYAYGGFAETNGTSLTPTEVKIDILIDDFPYASNQSATALLLKTSAETKLEEDGEKVGAEGVVARAPSFVAHFTWADNASVDGVTLPVRGTLLEEERKDEDGKSEHELHYALSYPRGEHINHDPVLGIASAGEPTVVGGAATPGAGVLLAAAAVAIAAAVSAAGHRRRGRGGNG